jgi:hypothetical protein
MSGNPCIQHKSAMRTATALAVVTLGGLGLPLLFAAQPLVAAEPVSLSTTFFEKHGISPRTAAQLRTTVVGRTIAIKTLQGGALEQVYYGAQRIDAKGIKTPYKIVEQAIQEERAGVLRLLLIYDWHAHSYICLENVGELEELGAAEGTCPYEIVATAHGNQTGGKVDEAAKRP